MKSKLFFLSLFLSLGVLLSAVIVTPGQASKEALSSEDTLTCADGCLAPKIIPMAPVVSSIARSSSNPTDAETVDFKVTFSEPVTGVDIGDFAPVIQDIGFVLVTEVSGSGSTYTVSVYTGYGNGTLSLDLVDYDSIMSASGEKLGGNGVHNGSFSDGETYTIIKSEN